MRCIYGISPLERCEPRIAAVPRDMRYIPIRTQLVPRTAARHGGRREKPYNAPSCVSVPPPNLTRQEHGVARLGIALDFGPQGGRFGCCPAALGALLPPTGCPCA